MHSLRAYATKHCLLADFVKSWGIIHLTSSPHYPQSNGFAKRYVRHTKPIITKALKSNQDLVKILLNLRATPITSSLPSPAEMMFGHLIATLLPSRLYSGPQHHCPALEDRREKMVQHHDSTACVSDLPHFHVG